MTTLQKFGWPIIVIVMIVVLSVTLCSSNKNVTFVDKAQELCKSIKSKVLFQNEQKGTVICE